ncbi:kinesin-like protein KIN-13B [Phalaenopsis equestris]|uniref:kinesin-like protein KIN-13B n=1 Tax=Phalaenopsis equestris TaxID=78828 RepID=UPI0009E4326C|nr:kinesin-like protein KIN-13B [Phalaenopsis equestris]
MNAAAAVGGRQMERSGHQHQRQYSPEQFLVDSFSSGGGGGGGKWMQSLPAPGFSSSKQVEYSRMLRSAQRGMRGEFMLSMDPSTPPLSSGRKKTGDDVSPSELSPGILDLHSFDTELLTDIPAPGLCDDAASFGLARERSLADSDSNIYSIKQFGKTPPTAENIISKGFPLEKDKPGSVAKIKVVVRKRPLNKKEIARKEEDIISIEQHTNSLTVHETKLKVDLTEFVEKHEFVFDAILDEDVSNDEVYRETVEPIIPAIFQRTKATCFAYGQTGSGKTYTMQPLPLRASQDILRLMHHTYRNQGFQLFVSFFEIYGGKLFDLLNDRRKLCMREDGKQKVCIVGLQEYRVSNVETIRELIEKGNATRSTGTTGANEESSRSHAILQLAIKKSVDANESKNFRRSADNNESKLARIIGKMSFIDLAGSERGADTTDNDKQTRIEGAEINKSLLALKECIRALDNDQVHIPFRGSKLTEVLRDSFIGDSRTVMISCFSPSSGSCEHTLNTLRYADRVKSLTKSSNPKKEIPNLRVSTVVPLSSVLPTYSAPETINETSKLVSSKRATKETSPPLNMEPAVREDIRVASSYSNHSNQSRGSSTPEEYDASGSAYERGKQSSRKAESYSVAGLDDRARRVTATQIKRTDIYDMDANNLEKTRRATAIRTKRTEIYDINANNSNSDDELNDLLKEEDDLVIAHRRQVEETINIVREEMKLLEEVDQPGNQLDEYITKLNVILSQKASGIANLQARLASFQRRLTEQNVLISSPAP